MSSLAFQRLQARIAEIRANGRGRLPSWRQKIPPTGGGETRRRAPGNVPAKPPDAAGSSVPPRATPVVQFPSGQARAESTAGASATATGATTIAQKAARFRGSCKAVCALSGRRCQLPAHGTGRSHHDGRRAFFLVATDGQSRFPERERLEAAASSRLEVFLG